MKENGYTFPVLFGKSYIDDLMPVLSIPRNWIVDANGKWEWEQVGFGTDENWEQSVLDKIDNSKPK